MKNVVLERDGEVIESGTSPLMDVSEMAESVTKLVNIVAKAAEAFDSLFFAWQPSPSAWAAMAKFGMQVAGWGEAEVRSYCRYQRIQRQIAVRGPRRRKHDGRWAKLSRR